LTKPLIQRSGLWEAIGDKIGRIAVHIGARVASAAERDEVLVSNTVKDLVAGSGTAFKDRGTHALKALPGEWLSFAKTASALALNVGARPTRLKRLVAGGGRGMVFTCSDRRRYAAARDFREQGGQARRRDGLRGRWR